jgi:hypothetical protein
MWLSEVVWVLYLLGLPALLIASAVRAVGLGPPRVEVARLAVMFCLIAANNGAITIVLAMAVLMYSPYDAMPWAEGVGGVLLIVASILWLTVHRAPAPDADTAVASAPLVNS